MAIAAVLMGGCSMAQDEDLIELARSAVEITEATLLALEDAGAVAEVEERELVPPRECQSSGRTATYRARRLLTVSPSEAFEPQRFAEVITDRWESFGFSVRVDDDGDAVSVQATVAGLEQLSAAFLYGERYQQLAIMITAVTDCVPIPDQFDDALDLRRRFDQLVDPATFGEPPA